MKLNIVGKLTQVFEVVNKETYSYQVIQITQTGYNQQTGEPLEPEVYEATIFNKKIKEINALQFAGKKVLATCWTRSTAKEHNGQTFYNINLNCSDIKEVSND